MSKKIEPVHAGGDQLPPPPAPQAQAVLLWAVATVAGLLLYNLYFQFLLSARLNAALTNPAASGSPVALLAILLPAGVSQGFIVGGAQWLVLRRYVKNIHWWIIASVIGWAIFYCLDVAFLTLSQPNGAVSQALDSLDPTGAGVLIGLLAGLVVGVCQWLVLRRWGQPALLWIFFVIVAQVASAVVSRLLGSLAFGPATGWIATGLLLGLGMAFVLNICWPNLLARGQVVE